MTGYSQDAKIVRSCKTDEPGAKLPHYHLWNDDDRDYTICTETYAFKQIAAKEMYEREHDL